MGTKKKPKDTSLEMRTSESDLGLKLCEDCLSCNRLAQILKENLLCESSVPVVEVLSAEIKTSTQSMISRMNFLEEAIDNINNFSNINNFNNINNINNIKNINNISNINNINNITSININ
ncbi:hypothetical protein HELRODRAFT_184265 [Helobdella robusta]|uniref:Uncharacterized protein n=1 Tax=Helobdella robusta TaxID=6412 RepID=T1FKV6_HELRO|nr:hypothetical protein HELRODRAFT_184265 [Helobdella robusta]ESO03834.1 hypothetical protein HELRODRAFT_184265 [Helobdella robusta]